MTHELIKRGQAKDIEALSVLSDRVFRSQLPEGTAMSVEFRPMFSPNNAHNLYFIEQDSLPVSLVGMMPGHMHVHGVTVSVASMGSVCTLAQYRQQHFASLMIEQVIKDFSANTSLLLVSGGLSIYRRIGCVDFGKWLGALIGPVDHVEDAIEVKATTSPDDVRVLHALYLAERLRFARTVADMRELLATMKAPHFRAQSAEPQLFQAYRQDQVIAYAVVIKPDYETGVVHVVEWAGDRTALLAMIKAAQTHFNVSRVHLTIASTDITTRSILDGYADWLAESNQGTVCVLNPAMLLREMGALIREFYGGELLLINEGENAWRVNWVNLSNNARVIAEGRLLESRAALSAWIFSDDDGLKLPLARTDDLNYI